MLEGLQSERVIAGGMGFEFEATDPVKPDGKGIAESTSVLELIAAGFQWSDLADETEAVEWCSAEDIICIVGGVGIEVVGDVTIDKAISGERTSCEGMRFA